MKKYYVIYVIGLNSYIRPLAQSIYDVTPNVAAAGKWETEELALEYASSINGILGYYIEIKPVYIKHY